MSQVGPCFLEIDCTLGQEKQIEDRFQWVVDLMDDGRGQSSNSGHLFLFLQSLLGPLVLADVFTDGDQMARIVLIVVYEAYRVADPDGTSITTQIALLNH